MASAMTACAGFSLDVRGAVLSLGVVAIWLLPATLFRVDARNHARA